jgi:hypothetical protein
MKYYFKGLSLLGVFISFSEYSVAAVDDEALKAKFVENMKLASVWVIEEGVPVYESAGKEGVFRKLLDEWSVQLWVEPWVEDEKYLAQFRFRARGIRYQTLNLYREKVGDYYYEFWFNRITGEGWSGERMRTEFFITRTRGIAESREIMERSDQFIESFEVGDRKILFPISSAELVYELEPRLYPENYKNSQLRDKEVVYENGVAKFK